MSGPTDLEVSSGDLQQIAAVLDGAGRSLHAHASDLDVAPDAGASSGEVGRALVSLATAVAGLAEHLGTLAETTTAANADFTGTDRAVGGALADQRGVLGP